MLGALCALAISSAVAAPAAATIVSPAAGTPVTVDGSIVLNGGLFTINCAVNLAATVGSGTTSSITGGSAVCGSPVVSFTFENAPWQKSLLLSGGALTGDWRIDGVRFTISAPSLITCTHYGALSGTWTSNGRDTVLTITMRLSVLLLDRAVSSGACIASPRVTGTLTLRGVVTV